MRHRGQRGHVFDAVGKADSSGPASEQVHKPLHRRASCVVGVEGQKDAVAAPQGGCDLLRTLGS